MTVLGGGRFLLSEVPLYSARNLRTVGVVDTNDSKVITTIVLRILVYLVIYDSG